MKPGTYTEREVVALLADAVMKAGGRVNWARDHGVALRLVDSLIAGKAHVSNCQRVVTALGLRRVVSYERI